MKKLLLTFCFCLLLTVPVITGAQGEVKYSPIVGIPVPSGMGVSDASNLTASEYVRVLYALSISIAAMLAVVKIIYAGIQYMLSDVVTSKQNAKADIKGALFGLLIVISAALLLQTINPKLLDLNIFEKIPTNPGVAPANSAVAPANQNNAQSVQQQVQDQNDINCALSSTCD